MEILGNQKNALSCLFNCPLKKPNYLTEFSDDEPVIRRVRLQIKVDHSLPLPPAEDMFQLVADGKKPQQTAPQGVDLRAQHHQTGLFVILMCLCLFTLICPPLNGN